MSPNEPLTIKSRDGDYKVFFESSISQAWSGILQAKGKVAVLVDEKIVSLGLLNELSTSVPRFTVKATESVKNLETVSNICDWLLDIGADKSIHLVAIGGGIIQDLATFSAHIYYRGITWSYVPTTLLGMCDSCIGGKCALNHGGFKNQVGVFHPPLNVWIVAGFLDTLGERDFRSGLGEMLKLSLTGPSEFYQDFCDQLNLDGMRKETALPWIIKSLQAKKWVIESDEYESDLRRILNYGHSFGHALESLSNNQISHGEAIVIGMDLINFIGMRDGLVKPDFAQHFHDFCTKAFDFIRLKDASRPYAGQLVEMLRRDKKVKFGKIALAFAREPGDLFVREYSIDENLESKVNEYFSQK